MTSIVKFTPLLGGANELSPLCYLLEIDDCSILLDCGWDDRFAPASLGLLKEVAPRVDYVLVSHPDLAHMGALPYAFGQLGMNAEVFATLPVSQMGRHFCVDAYRQRTYNEEFATFTLDDVEQAFRRVTAVKHTERQELGGSGQGISVTPWPSGRTLGGSVWQIQKGSEDLIYAVDCNMQRERLCPGTHLAKFERPALLVTDSFNAQYSLQDSERKSRDKELCMGVMRALRNGGNVLLPVDTAGRVFELMLVLERMWIDQHHHLGTFPLVLLNSQGRKAVEYAKGMTEYMNKRCNFAFEKTQMVETLDDLRPLLTSFDGGHVPTCVLATGNSLETGFARELFLEWSSNPLNVVIFTERQQPGSLGRLLVDLTRLGQRPPRSMELWVHRREKLTGDEKESFLAEERRRREAEAATRAAKMAKQEAEEKQRKLDEMDSDEEDQMLAEELVANNRMFPAVEINCDYDDYGEVINPDDYRDPDELEAEKELWGAGMEQEAEAEEVSLEDSVPTKCVSGKRSVQIKCSVKYVDLEGRYDEQTQRDILQKVKPQKLVLVHGDRRSTDHLRVYCEKELVGKSNVHAPQSGESVVLTSDRSVQRAKVDEKLFRSLDLYDVGDYAIAHVDACVAMDESAGSAQAQLVAAEDMGHAVVMIGDVRLHLLQPALAGAGIPCEFKDEMLVCCKGLVLLKKSQDLDSTIQMEGALCSEWYAVREVLNSLFDCF